MQFLSLRVRVVCDAFDFFAAQRLTSTVTTRAQSNVATAVHGVGSIYGLRAASGCATEAFFCDFDLALDRRFDRLSCAFLRMLQFTIFLIKYEFFSFLSISEHAGSECRDVCG